MARCFIITPYGNKLNADGKKIDFDAVFADVVDPAVRAAGLEVVRSDHQLESGPIFRQMIQDIATTDVCIADITTLNANVFYELGVRHSLCRGVTVLIRLEGQPLPFDISPLRVLAYGPIPPKKNGRTTSDREKAVKKARLMIIKAIEHARDQKKTDSLVFSALPNLSVAIDKPTPIESVRRQSYPSKKNPGRQIGLIGGSLKDVRGVSVWVNSENTDMQMSRFYEQTISGTIRYLGANKHPDGRVSEDLIANDLASWMRRHNATNVLPATVIKTIPGNLDKHGVKFVLHVAAVHATPQQGYEPVRELRECVRKALDQVDENRQSFGNQPATVILPLLGTGTGGGKIEEVAPRLFQEALNYLDHEPTTVIGTVWFLAYSDQHWNACVKILTAMVRENRLSPGVAEG